MEACLTEKTVVPSWRAVVQMATDHRSEYQREAISSLHRLADNADADFMRATPTLPYDLKPTFLATQEAVEAAEKEAVA